MHYVSIDSFCERTGLNVTDVSKYEEQGVISSVHKGAHRFFSLRELYRMKGILFLMRTSGLTINEAIVRMDSNISA